MFPTSHSYRLWPTHNPRANLIITIRGEFFSFFIQQFLTVSWVKWSIKWWELIVWRCMRLFSVHHTILETLSVLAAITSTRKKKTLFISIMLKNVKKFLLSFIVRFNCVVSSSLQLIPEWRRNEGFSRLRRTLLTVVEVGRPKERISWHW